MLKIASRHSVEGYRHGQAKRSRIRLGTLPKLRASLLPKYARTAKYARDAIHKGNLILFD